jgi:radical SAM superfamily enzyme YgiQ (UPF0313 family)
MILLINPPSPEGTVSNKDMMGGLGQVYPDVPGASTVPPLDLFYCAAVLKDKGVEFGLLDALSFSGSGDEFRDAVRELKPEHVFIRTSLPTYRHDAVFAAEVKRETGAKTWFFGPAAELFDVELLNGGGADVVFSGEAEMVMSGLAASGFVPEGAPGLVFLRGGKAVRTAPVPAAADLDSVAYPLWSARDSGRYRVAAFFGDEPYLPVQTSRGCPFGCSYCPYTKLQGGRWRERGVENVLGELKRDHDEFGISNFLFRDPEFTLNEERTLRLCKGMEGLGFTLSWVCETRPDTLNDRLIGSMARAGCRQINFGVESVGERTLANVRRKYVPPEKIIEVVSAARKHGVKLFCFFIMGLPGQTASEILNDIRFAASVLPGLVQFTYATPYPSTDMFTWAQANRLIEVSDYSKYTGYVPVMRNEHLTRAQLEKLFSYAYDRLRSRGPAESWPARLRSLAGAIRLDIRELRLRYFL